MYPILFKVCKLPHSHLKKKKNKIEIILTSSPYFPATVLYISLMASSMTFG